MTAPGDRSLTGEARSEALASLAESLHRRGIGGPAITILIRVENSGRCRPPLEAAEVERIVAGVWPRGLREDVQRAGVGRKPGADPETLARVAVLVVGVLLRGGPRNVRGIFKRVRARRGHILDALEALRERGKAAYRLRPLGACVSCRAQRMTGHCDEAVLTAAA